MFYKKKRKYDFVSKIYILSQITTAFLRGYRGEMAIDGVWLARLPELLESRRLLMYGNHCRNWDFDAVGPEELANLARHRREIEENVPMLAIDCRAL